MKTGYLFARLVLTGFALTIGICPPAPAQKHDPSLNPYVDFLTTQRASAREYILDLFKSKDIVVLCERDHRDTTQYDLYLSVLRDSSFAAEVGNVFTEVGMSNLNPQINAFLHADGLSEDSVEGAILNFHRNCTWAPVWEKENFSYLLRGMYAINRRLPPALKLNLYPSDVPFDWSKADTATYRQFQNSLESFRDSVMAQQIIRVFDSLGASGSARKKALVIMNYRHAFGHRFEYPAGRKPNNVGRFLFEKYGGRFANVYVSWLALALKPPGNDIDLRLIQDGKWDAAFKALGKEDMGFDLEGSPFGRDHFDIWPRDNPFTFADVFTGLVYWLPLEKQRCVVGIPNFIDPVSAPEIMRRMKIYNAAVGRTTDFTLEGLRNDCNERRVFGVEGLDSLITLRDRWLH